MSSVNFAAKEIAVKIVFYGPGLGGKTTTLRRLHKVLHRDSRGALITLPTGEDRTILFDFMPIKLKSTQGFTLRVYLYTVPGQVHYNATRKLVLAGADGVVFVADSQSARLDANLESMENLVENLRDQGYDPTTMPTVLQYNKRDLDDVMSIDQLNEQLNGDRSLRWFETSALRGAGVVATLKQITRETLTRLRESGVFATREKTDLTPHASLFSDAVSGGGLQDKLARFAEQAGDAPRPPMAPPEEAGGVTFASLWPTGVPQAAVVEVEDALAAGDGTEATVALETLLELTIGGDAFPAAMRALPEPERIRLLGIDGRDYVRARQLISRASAGMPVSVEDALAAYNTTVGVRLRLRLSGS